MSDTADNLLLLAIAKANGHPDPTAWAQSVQDHLSAEQEVEVPPVAPEPETPAPAPEAE